MRSSHLLALAGCAAAVPLTLPNAFPVLSFPILRTRSSKASAPAAHTTCTPQPSTGGNTENGVVNKNCCTDVTVIFARGTVEPGNVGYFTGPPFIAALRKQIGASRVTVQGVEYPATTTTLATGGGVGPANMAADVKQALLQCPNTKIVLSGYSQGGEVVHNAFKQGITASQIAAAVMFGDPYNGQSVGGLAPAVVKEYCAAGDVICNGSGSFVITEAHLSYANDASDAAAFIVKTLGL
ncbi:cutinase-domain-containing protein [Microthyrium microscopicum]|uniref:Cutinase n=1 Tax=Microthyrium microscopicum TaxID=703497 RepID=A0A6A6U7K6_9PEZI|nr:cutinase-domain-containing protein [Microthyrium microscopicum]